MESVCHFLREKEGEIQKLKSTLFESKGRYHNNYYIVISIVLIEFSTVDVHVDVQEQPLLGMYVSLKKCFFVITIFHTLY